MTDDSRLVYEWTISQQAEFDPFHRAIFSFDPNVNLDTLVVAIK